MSPTLTEASSDSSTDWRSDDPGFPESDRHLRKSGRMPARLIEVEQRVDLRQESSGNPCQVYVADQPVIRSISMSITGPDGRRSPY